MTNKTVKCLEGKKKTTWYNDFLKPKKSLKNLKKELSVSCFACKELGNHPSVLTRSRKLNKLKNQPFLGSLREGKTQGKLLPPRLESQANTGNHDLPEQRLPSRNHSRNQHRGRKYWTITGELLETQCGQLWELKNSGGWASLVAQ